MTVIYIIDADETNQKQLRQYMGGFPQQLAISLPEGIDV
jgi:hypothetical protein